MNSYIQPLHTYIGLLMRIGFLTHGGLLTHTRLLTLDCSHIGLLRDPGLLTRAGMLTRARLLAYFELLTHAGYLANFGLLAHFALRVTRVWIFHAETLPKKCVFSAWKTHKKPVEGVTKFNTTMWVIYLITVVKNVENTQNNSIISFSTCNKRKLTNKMRKMLPLTTNSNISIIQILS